MEYAHQTSQCHSIRIQKGCLRMGYTHTTSFLASIKFGKASRKMDSLKLSTSWLHEVDI